MIFNSFQFLWLFPIIFMVFSLFLTGGGRLYRSQNLMLIVTSYLLYIQWNPWYSLVLFYVTVCTFFGAKLLYKKSSKMILASILSLMALTPLLVFKYWNFSIENINQMFSKCDVCYSLPGLNWAVPLGISFFSFQALGYMLDVYHKRIEPETDFMDYVLFVSFFPQIMSGPISRAKDLLPQIKAKRQFDYVKAVKGMKLLLWGMFMKCVFADRIAMYADTVFNNYIHQSASTLWLGSFAYSLQIYGDFAGYSLMAVGVGKAMGFDLVNNFNRPYFAKSITEFWKRWHISLTRWLTTHVYIAMGGNRCSIMKQYWNIMVTFIVSGIWHGANWTFIVWGVMHGILQIVEKVLGLDPKGHLNGKTWIKRSAVVRMISTFCLVNIAWIFFRSPSIQDAFAFIHRMMTAGGELFIDDNNSNNLMCLLAVMIVLIKELFEEFKPSFSLFNNTSRIVRWASYVVVLCMILMFGVLDSSQFIYVSF